LIAKLFEVGGGRPPEQNAPGFGNTPAVEVPVGVEALQRPIF
jgi:hypothetical protein